MAGGAQLGEIWIEEAQKSGSGRQPAGHPLGALRCVARQCAKNRLVTYQLKGTPFRSTYAPCGPVMGRLWSRELVPRGTRARVRGPQSILHPTRPRSIAEPSSSRLEIVLPLHFLYRRSCAEHMYGW